MVFVSRAKSTPDFEAFRSADFQLTLEEISGEAIARARIVHSSAWPFSREPGRSAVAKALRLAHERSKIVSLNPNYAPQVWPDREEAKVVLGEVFRFVSIINPSWDDARRLFGRGYKPEEYIGMYHDLGPALVVLTMGAEGVLISDKGQLTHIPARPVEVIDATGAGDAFWAGFLVALLDGNPLERCALFAREVAERKLATLGHIEGTIDREEVYRLVTTFTSLPGT